MSKKYFYRKLSNKNIGDLVTIHKTINSSHVTKSKSGYASQLDTSYLNINHIGYIAYSKENEPAAFYGVIPMELISNNQKILAAQSANTMTNPKHQRQGLFISLAKKTYDLARDEGIKFIFGFPNASSFPGFQKKLNWNFIDKLNNYDFFVLAPPFSMILSNKNKFFKKYKDYILKFFASKNQKFNSSFMMDSENDTVVNKNEKYFNYKYDKKQHKLISSEGMSCWIKIERDLSIGDISFDKNYQDKEKLILLKKLIKKLKRLSFLLGIIRIKTYVSPNSKIDILLSKIKKPRSGLSIGKVDLEKNIFSENIKFTFSDFDTF